MKTQIEYAQGGVMTTAMRKVAKNSSLAAEEVMHRVASGKIAIMVRGDRVCGIGQGLSTRVNVNIGTSGARSVPEEEKEKAKIAEQYGADTISELSMGGSIRDIRAAIAAVTTLPITTVPIYETTARNGIRNIDEDSVIKTIAD